MNARVKFHCFLLRTNNFIKQLTLNQSNNKNAFNKAHHKIDKSIRAFMKIKKFGSVR